MKVVDKGIVYIAFGDKHVKEAMTSAKSVKNHVPNIPITIYTNLDLATGDCFDAVEKVTPTDDVKECKMAYLSKTPYEHTLFLDTDTYVCGDISELFLLLNQFDLALAHTPGRDQIPYFNLGIPTCYPEFNSGVILFNRQCIEEKLFSDWLRFYRDLRGVKNIDQPSLRKAVYYSKLRVATLTPEYNCRLPVPTYLKNQVKIIHGRCNDFMKVENMINRFTGMRIFNPRNQTLETFEDILYYLHV